MFVHVYVIYIYLYNYHDRKRFKTGQFLHIVVPSLFELKFVKYNI